MKIKTSNIKKTALLLIILVGINIQARADESNIIGEGLRSAFMFFGFILILISFVGAFLIHIISNLIVSRKRNSFWRVLIGVVLMGSIYVWIEIESSYFEHLLSNSLGSFFAYFLPYFLFTCVGGIVGFILSPKKVSNKVNIEKT